MTIFKIHLIVPFKRQTWDQKIFQSSVLVLVWEDLRSVPSDSERTVANSPPGMTTTCVSAGNHEGNLCHPHTPQNIHPWILFPAKAPQSLDSWKTFSFPYERQKAYGGRGDVLNYQGVPSRELTYLGKFGKWSTQKVPRPGVKKAGSHFRDRWWLRIFW